MHQCLDGFRLNIQCRSIRGWNDSDSFGLKIYFGFIRIDVSDWIRFSRINFQAFLIKRDWERFSDWVGLTRIGSDTDIWIVLIGSDWLPIRNFRQGGGYSLNSKTILAKPKIRSLFLSFSRKELHPWFSLVSRPDFDPSTWATAMLHFVQESALKWCGEGITIWQQCWLPSCR